MGGWIGGQAEYVMTPYADFNLLKLPPKEQSMPKIKDLALLSDIFPTGFHGAVTAGVGVGSTVYVAGAGPVGLACAASCQLLGAACVIVGDLNQDRLAQAKSFGCKTVDLTKSDTVVEQIEKILGEPFVDGMSEKDEFLTFFKLQLIVLVLRLEDVGTTTTRKFQLKY